MLAKGGNAIDAAIAVQAMLGLVEPQSSGIGGGAFLLYYDAATGEVTGYNGREKAPQGATADMLLTDEGKPLARSEAMLGGRATGVPGALSLLEMAHADHGDLPWSAAFEGAIALAREGYPLTGRTHKYIHGSHPQSGAPDVQAIFRMPNGELAREGDRFVNAAYADTLEKIARGGTTAFYDSDEIAGEIVGKTHRDPLPGTITRDDLRDYRALRTTPVCRPYRTYVVCVPPPPSSGVAVLQILGILEGTDIDRRGPDDAQGWFLFAEASRLAYADRDRYVADPDFVDVPVEEMLDPAYLARRRAMIGGKVMRAPEAGRFEPTMPGEDSTREPGGTTHFVIADAQGNVASMTTTIESYFGSGRTVGGFFLNNQLTDFAFSPVDSEGRPAANAVAGGKRPFHTIIPGFAMKDGQPLMAYGMMGGPIQAQGHMQLLLRTQLWGQDVQVAADAPRWRILSGLEVACEPAMAPDLLQGLRDLGHVVHVEAPDNAFGFGGAQLVQRLPEGGYSAGSDPRKDGQAAGF